MEYWEIVENPTGETYQQLMKVLCDHSDKFYFVTRKELKYNPVILEKFQPYILETYKTKKWANTITKGPKATVYVMESNRDTCSLLQQSANTLYDWVAPNLPEDLTFLKNDFAWFSCTTHEEYGEFSIRSEYYRKLLGQISGLQVRYIDL
ncbi:hypothetical protein [Ornithinibacillus bavariensis]|uniref:Uncharacterized protein n=1 Tax=Ornithinibacillus bavariensis TaxID=545502 RepID=A0A919X7E9_9BACI|nr:hypothetical protein [Ornithinibacillus bavariensis]GIO27351.1 hypothetical protein J43TS3_19620 [Ornithinibacillus bavariensis]HAM81959.1 hypothetical protein [Ornithinibacillus sp.]